MAILATLPAGLLSIAAILECAYILNLRKNLRTKLNPRFGALWSRTLEPHCPACSKPLGAYGKYGVGYMSNWSFKCLQCKELVPLIDDEGRVLELKEAKALLNLKPQSNNMLQPTLN